MTDSNEHDMPETTTSEDAAPPSGGTGPTGGVPALPGGGAGQNEMAGLVLLINTVLGGLGTLYVTTKSAEITLCSALLVLVTTIVVLVVKQMARPGGGLEGEDRSGQ
ncbi:hypothetical protein ACH4Y0_38065 [Streptomyces sp. NPDC020707]|uniref:hypothetical protein n=1 Tax=Streptomyces sp. NPDC020707 TaxID=3365084 RepID=UPI0037AC4A62